MAASKPHSGVAFSFIERQLRLLKGTAKYNQAKLSIRLFRKEAQR